MEKEFVPYELALELKALGFDEDGLGMYSKNGSVLPLVPYTSEDKAILFSQAFRWFRENDLHNSIEFDFDTNKYIAYCNGLTNNIFDTYEEAELACLQKLIEIVKTK